MKKFLRILFISLGLLLGLTLILTGIAMWVIFTPERLTPILKRQIPQLVGCKAEVGAVELTILSTFPRFGIQVDGLTLINPVVGAESDTLLEIRRFKGAIDVKALWRHDELILDDITLSNGRINAYVGRDGKNNFDIFPTDNPDDTTSTAAFGRIDAGEVRLKNIDISYVDSLSGIRASVSGLSSMIEMSKDGDTFNCCATLMPTAISYADSGTTAMVKEFSGRVECTLKDNLLECQAALSTDSTVSLDMGGESYLSEGLVSANISARADLGRRSVTIDDLTLSLNGLRLDINGTVALNSMAIDADAKSSNAAARINAAKSNDAAMQDGSGKSTDGAMPDSIAGSAIDVDVEYKFSKWPVKQLLALAPPAMARHFEEIEAGGILSSEGTIKGRYRSGESMPLFDVHLSLDNGSVKCSRSLPLPLVDVNCNVNICTDLADDKISRVSINNLRVKTPRSSFDAHGVVDRLFTDMRADLAVNADLTLEELAPMLPGNLNARMKGRVTGKIDGAATLSQLRRMDLGKMRLSALLDIRDLDAAYNDSLALRSNAMTLDCALPNPKPSRKNRNFVAARIIADTLDARMAGVLAASMLGGTIEIEASDVRDTTHFPAMMFRFVLDKLTGHTDSLNFATSKPSGSITLSTSHRRSDKPRFRVAFSSGEFYCNNTAGDRVFFEKVDLKAGVTYDELQRDLFLKWRPRGSLDMKNAGLRTSKLPHPVDILSVKMDFTPREFNIESAGVVIANSDFNLSGKLSNILPYFRRDSTLRGDFNFTSSMTDIPMLMALTSGLGSGEATNNDNAVSNPGSDTVAREKAQARGEVATQEVVETQGTAPMQKALLTYGTARTEETPSIQGTAPVCGVPLTQKSSPRQGGSGPFMVPHRMDIALHADVKRALWQADTLRNLRGDVLVKNGTLVLDSLTFSSPATDMGVTAIYRTERLNHLFLGMRLHMLNVEIAELLHMIPDLETLMPMLASFGGRGEFHITAETNLDSTYTMKMSTLCGAASIRGNDLVLMDGQTFGEISKMLRFNKKTQNKVDSLAAEFTVFRNQIDVFPFLVVMDNYKAIVGGRHDTNMSFDYNISLVESPLPIRLSVKVYGTLDDPHFKLIKNPYKDFYRPISRRVVEGQQLRLRNIIRNSLLGRKENDGD